MVNNVQYACGTWQIYEHGCLHDVKLPPIIPQFLLHYVLEEYNMNSNSCTTIVLSVCLHYSCFANIFTFNEPISIPDIVGVDSGGMA